MWSFIGSFFVKEARKYVIASIVIPLLLSLGYWLIKQHFEQKLALQSAMNYQAKQAILTRMSDSQLSDYKFDRDLVYKQLVKCDREHWCHESVDKKILDDFVNVN